MAKSFPRSKVLGISPVLVVYPLMRAVDFYWKKLGFDHPRLFGTPPTFAVLERDGLALCLQQADFEVTISPCGDGACRGPDGRTWYRFGMLQNDEYLAINLDANLHLVVDDEEWRKRIFSESFNPICLYSEATRGIDGKNPVIALSFTELLSRLLNESSITQLYWQSVDFESHADAAQFTRRASFDDAIGEKRRRKKRKP